MNIRLILRSLYVGISIIGISACNGGSGYISVADSDSKPKEPSPRDTEREDKEDEIIDKSFTVAFDQTPSGVKTIHLKFNDAASFNAIFDTGCSGLLISMQEAMSLVKAGTLSLSDRVGVQQSSIASGEIMENEVFNIHTVTIMDINGRPHTLNDVPATVANNPEAPVLVGNFVIDQLAEKSYTMDLSSRVIVFNP